MADLHRKTETIRSIEDLQLPANLIFALDDHIQAEDICRAVSSLQILTQHWN